MSHLESWTAYHGIRTRDVDAETFTFGGLADFPEGIHLGSLAQAKMRAGRGTVIEVIVNASQLSPNGLKRVKDRPGGWRTTNRRARGNGSAALVYLNRYEGVDEAALAKILKIGSDRFDRMSDAEVRRRVPELKDSWVVLDPEIVTIRRALDPDEVARMLQSQPTELGGQENLLPCSPTGR
ncbi:hypothetical protein AYJ57_20610 (plasmid) [Salipiger sp. CCB-MM3]|uniref:hypothetical protein n=1 Tax=Salipiger sp. CCB-MM3 TaxID=1792508 RepID=UPI00080AB8CE|nr:hypothetical protein [Salipiger sp. CCB-MM3]ANT62890.1 hypothetical protein AYJ57_20610 [Salipiger sp. CCB-MM3]